MTVRHLVALQAHGEAGFGGAARRPRGDRKAKGLVGRSGLWVATWWSVLMGSRLLLTLDALPTVKAEIL